MRRAKAAAFLACGLLLAGCASDKVVPSGTEFYGASYYGDYWWYAAGGCCVDYPGDIGPPPHPEHPIATPPAQPANPIATPPSRPSTPSRPMPSPRPAAMSRGGGGRR
jgi:hypothetical protein